MNRLASRAGYEQPLRILREPLVAHFGEAQLQHVGIYVLQQWFNLSDPGVEEALNDSVAMYRFVGLDLGREALPDEATICNFRHLLSR